MKWSRARFVRWGGVFGLMVLALAGGLWWRTGAVEIENNEAAAQSLPGSEEGNSAEFSVLTYNVQARPWFDETREKFALMSPLLNAYDLCAMQECFKDHRRLWEKAEHPVKIHDASLRHPFKITGSGLSLLGKFPLKGVEHLHYASAGDFQNWPASKGALLGRFLVRGMPLDVYTTHFVAGKKAASMAARVSQASELIKFVRRNSPQDHSVILMGDFNMRPSRGPEDKAANSNNPKVYVFDHLVHELGLKDASDEVNGPTGTEIDRVLFRPGKGFSMKALAWQRDAPAFHDGAQKPLSDHAPVIVRFALAKE